MGFRGELKVMSMKAAGLPTILAVFDDGLLVIDPSKSALGVILGAGGGLIPALFAKRSTRKREATVGDILRGASDSVKAREQLKGSKSISLADLADVTIEKGFAKAAKLTIATAAGDKHVYRFQVKEHDAFMTLLTPVLGEKLNDRIR